MFRAFSDPTRLRLLHLLQAGEYCVGDLAASLDVPQPRVSRHLTYLRRAGLVRMRRAGRWAFYALADPVSPFHERLLGCLSTCFAAVPEMRADEERAARLRKGPGCCGPAAAQGAA